MEENYEYTPLKVEIPDLQKPDSDPRQLRAFSSHEFSNVFLVFGPDQGPNGPDFTLSTEVSITIVNPPPTPTPTTTVMPTYTPTLPLINGFHIVMTLYRKIPAPDEIDIGRFDLSVNSWDEPIIGLPDQMWNLEIGDPDYILLGNNILQYAVPEEDRSYVIVATAFNDANEPLNVNEFDFVWGFTSSPDLTVLSFQTGDVAVDPQNDSRCYVNMFAGRRYLSNATNTIYCTVTRGEQTWNFQESLPVGSVG